MVLGIYTLWSDLCAAHGNFNPLLSPAGLNNQQLHIADHLKYLHWPTKFYYSFKVWSLVRFQAKTALLVTSVVHLGTGAWFSSVCQAFLFYMSFTFNYLHYVDNHKTENIKQNLWLLYPNKFLYNCTVITYCPSMLHYDLRGIVDK